MKCDKIIQLPNQHTVHGLRVQKYPQHRLCLLQWRGRACRSQRRQEPERPEQYCSIFTAVDGETMKVAWQVMVDGNLDNVDADYQGKYCFATCYNSEKGVNLAEMMANEQDWVVIFNLKRIEEAVARAASSRRCNGVPVLDGRQGSPLHPLRAGGERPARHQHRARRHPRRRQRQAVADGDRVRRAQVRRPVRRQDPAARHRRRRAGAGPRAVAHRLRRPRQRLHDAVHRQPDLQVEHRGREAGLQGREGRPDPSRSSTSTTSPATTTPPWARPRRPTANG